MPTDETSAQTFNVRVTFTPQSNVNLDQYLDATTVGHKDNNATDQYVIPVTVAANGSSGTYTITGIPSGTGYSITEETTGAFTTAYDSNQTKTQASGGITANASTTVTNKYRQITFTKNDAKQKGSADIPVSGAKYVLVKLTEEFYNYYTGLTAGSDAKTAIETTFKNAAAVTDLKYTNAENTPNVPCYEVISGNPAASSEMTTGSTSPNVGKFTVTDSDITGGLQDGGHYFFLEVDPEANSMAANNYTKNNTLSADKIITIAGDTYSYTPTYTDPRKTGSLELEKTLASGTETEDTFTYNVTISRPTDGNNDFDLTKYFTRRDVSSTTYLDSGAHSIAVTDLTIAEASVTFKVTMTAGSENNKTIYGIPYGAEYTVTETNPTAPANTTWKTVSSSGLTGEVYDANDETDSHKATIKNGLVGSIKLKKTVDGVRPNNPTATYPFNVTLTAPGTNGSFEGYTITAKQGNADATVTYVQGTSSITSGQAFTVSVPPYSNDNDIITISGLPYGTTFTVYENSQSDGSTSNHIQTGTVQDGNAPLTGSVASAETIPVQEITNTYKDTGTLKLEKLLQPGSESFTSTSFTYKVELTAPEGVTLGTGTNQYTIGCDGTLLTTTSTPAAPANALYVTNGSGRSTYTFYVQVSNGTPVNVTGIPYDTTYTVTELGTVNYMPTDWVKITSAAQTGTIGTDMQNVDDTQKNVAFITNGNTGSLTITKALGDHAPTSANTESFKIHVTMTAPSNTTIDWSKYNYTIDSGSVSRNENVLEYTITGGGTRTISGIPYGVNCTVTEVVPSNVGYTPAYTPSGIDSAGVSISASTGGLSADATVTNNYSDTCTLTVKKTAPNCPTSLNDRDYTFTVSLTNTSLTLNYSDLSFDPSGKAPASYTNITNGFSFTVTLDKDEQVAISGLPLGTTYVVTETGTETGYTTSVDVDGNGYSTASTTTAELSASNKTDVVTFKNAYPDTKTLKLTKTTEGEVPSSLGSSPKYKFEVELTAPASPAGVSLLDYSPFTYYVGTDTEHPSTVALSGNKLVVYVEAGDGNYVTIQGIPENATYKVVEKTDRYYRKGNGNNYSEQDVPTGVTLNPSYTPATINSTAATLNSNQEVTVKNTYPGSLTITKKVAGGYPTTLPASYSFNVTFDFPNGTSSATLDVGGTSESFNDGESKEVTVTKTSAITAAGDSIKISSIPLGTSYTVTEVTTGLPADITVSGEVIAGDGTNGTTVLANCTINATTPTKTETITNQYPSKGSLTLKKLVSGTNAPTASQNFIFYVTLTPPENVVLSDYLDSTVTALYDSDSTSPTYGKYVITVPSKAANDSSYAGYTISNIPYGTSFTVEEATTGPFTTAYETNDGTTTTADASTGTITTGKLAWTATATNTYQDTGDLTLTKIVEGTTPATAPTSYKFDVKLLSDYDFANYGITVKKGNTAVLTLDSSNFGTESTKHTCEFSVNVEPGSSNTITINNLPYGTQYIVSETGCTISGSQTILPTNMKKRGEVAASPASTISSSNNSPDVTIYNAYTGTLTLNKAFTGAFPTSASDRNNQAYTFRVRLTPPTANGISDFVNYTITETRTVSETTNTTDAVWTTNPSDSSDKYIDVTVKQSVPVTLGGIPYGTSYTVEEVNYYSKVVPDGSISSTTIDATHSAQTETITNTYVRE